MLNTFSYKDSATPVYSSNKILANLYVLGTFGQLQNHKLRSIEVKLTAHSKRITEQKSIVEYLNTRVSKL